MSELKKDGRYENLDHIILENAAPLAQPDHNLEDTTNFKFKDDPNDEVYLISDTSFFKVRWETLFWNNNNTVGATWVETSIVNIPYDIGTIKNVDNPSLILIIEILL